jgi:hypothetical protein
MPLLHVSMNVHRLRGSCSLLSYFKILYKLICIKNLCIQCLWTLKRFWMQVVSWLVLKINCRIDVRTLSGRIYICKNINNKITADVGMLQNTGITILWWTHLYRGAANMTARQRLSVYRSVWLCCLKRIRGWVHIYFVLQSLIHVVVMYVHKNDSQ